MHVYQALRMNIAPGIVQVNMLQFIKPGIFLFLSSLKNKSLLSFSDPMSFFHNKTCRMKLSKLCILFMASRLIIIWCNDQ